MNNLEKLKKQVLKDSCELIKLLTLMIARSDSETDEFEQYSDMLDVTVNSMVDCQTGEMSEIALAKLSRFIKYNLIEARHELLNQEFRNECDTLESVTFVEEV